MNPTDSPAPPALAERLDALDRKLDFAKMEEVTLWRAFRELNKPEMRRALGFLLSFLRNLAGHPMPGATRAGPSLSTPN